MTATIGDLALGLYENGRYEAVCDALDMVWRCGGALSVRDLLIFGLSAHHLGRPELARWCRQQARRLAVDNDALPATTRGLILQAERLLEDAGPVAPRLNVVGVRVQQNRSAA